MQNIANIQIELYYHNNISKPIEASFYFAISCQSCFNDFEAQIGEKIMKGQIKEKEEAKQEYEKGIQEGKTMAYTEVNSDLQDTIEVKLGNIEPKENITIRLSYLELLNTTNDGQQYELVLPFTLSPRYNSWRSKNKEYVSD